MNSLSCSDKIDRCLAENKRLTRLKLASGAMTHEWFLPRQLIRACPLLSRSTKCKPLKWSFQSGTRVFCASSINTFSSSESFRFRLAWIRQFLAITQEKFDILNNRIIFEPWRFWSKCRLSITPNYWSAVTGRLRSFALSSMDVWIAGLALKDSKRWRKFSATAERPNNCWNSRSAFLPKLPKRFRFASVVFGNFSLR